MTVHHPSHSQWGLIFANAMGADPRIRCPIPYSMIMRGIPAVTRAMKYGMR
jgi:hypothetical protein